MKRVLKVFAVIGLILWLSGCDNNDLTITECTSTNHNIVANYNLNSKYIIYSKDNIVTKIEISETVVSPSIVILDYFENYFSTIYRSNHKLYGGYTNKLIKENDELKSTTIINYNEIDMEKYVAEHVEFKNYINENNELTLEGIINTYTSSGATCK